jgi:hypothetical protein
MRGGFSKSAIPLAGVVHASVVEAAAREVRQ